MVDEPHGVGLDGVSDLFVILDCWQRVEDVFAIYTVVAEGIDGEIADSETREVLEEVGALAWIDLEVLEPSLNDDTGG